MVHWVGHGLAFRGYVDKYGNEIVPTQLFHSIDKLYVQ
jgi:hypothetical protein